MNVIADTWRGIVQRRLWPLAVVLVGALIAVPLLLAKAPAPAAVPQPGAQAPKTDGDSTSFVTLATAPEADTGSAKRRRVLGAEKDPFRPAPKPKAKKAKKAKAKATPTPTATETPTSGGTGGSATPPASTPPPAAPTPTPGPTVPKGSIRVRFGLSDTAELPLQSLKRLEPLLSEEEPVLVYEGVDGHGAATFSIPGTVTAEGDGKCDPDPENCQTLKLKPGETEFITLADTGDAATANKQFQLDLVKIYKKATVVTETDATSDGS
jgi:hypothetical protein